MPAFFNGAFGHKPSGGLVPGTGQHPVAAGVALKYLSTGPICRRPEDLALLTSIMLGPDGMDEGCEEFPNLQSLPERVKGVDISSLTVYWVDGIHCLGVSPLEKNMKVALDNVIGDLSGHCAKVCPLEDTGLMKHLAHATDIWACMLHQGNPNTFVSHMQNGQPFSAIWELCKWAILGRSPFTLAALLLCVLEQAPTWTPKRTERFLKEGSQLQQEFEQLLGDNAVLLCPSHPKVAPRHAWPLTRPFNWIYTGIWNMMLAPATQVPLGLSEVEQLPVGVQIIARRGNDHLTLAVANHLAASFGGWVPPSAVQITA